MSERAVEPVYLTAEEASKERRPAEPTRAEQRQEPQPPSAPSSLPELVLGYLDEILRELEALRRDTEGPKGSGSIGDAGTVTGPVAGQAIVSLPAPGAGRYRINVKTLKSAAGAAGNVNARLQVGGGFLAELLTVTSTQDHEFPDVHLRAGDDVTVRAIAADGAVDYMAFLVLTRIA